MTCSLTERTLPDTQIMVSDVSCNYFVVVSFILACLSANQLPHTYKCIFTYLHVCFSIDLFICPSAVHLNHLFVIINF